MQCTNTETTKQGKNQVIFHNFSELTYLTSRVTLLIYRLKYVQYIIWVIQDL